MAGGLTPSGWKARGLERVGAAIRALWTVSWAALAEGRRRRRWAWLERARAGAGEVGFAVLWGLSTVPRGARRLNGAVLAVAPGAANSSEDREAERGGRSERRSADTLGVALLCAAMELSGPRAPGVAAWGRDVALTALVWAALVALERVWPRTRATLLGAGAVLAAFAWQPAVALGGDGIGAACAGTLGLAAMAVRRRWALEALWAFALVPVGTWRPVAALALLAPLAGRWRALVAVLVVLQVESLPVWTTPEAPDLVLVTVDALRADEAAKLASFSDGHAIWTNGSWTLPALASLHTASSPDVHGAGRDGAGFRGPTLPDLAGALRGAGFRTFGLIGGNPLAARAVHASSFDLLGLPRSDGLVPRGRSNASSGRPLFARLLWPEPWRADAEVLVDGALDLLRRSPQRAFVWVHLMDVHLPWPDAPCRADVLGLPGAREALAADPWWSTPEGMACLRAGYSTRAERVDAALIALKAGLRPGALLVLTADHGEALGDAGFEHGHTVDPVVTRVPLWTSDPWPDQPGDLVDLGHTLAAWAGVEGFGEAGARDLREVAPPREIRLGPALYGAETGGVDEAGVLWRAPLAVQPSR